MKEKGKQRKGSIKTEQRENKGQNKTSPFLSPLVLLQRVTVSTRWRKGLCSITLSSETEIRVLSLEPHGTHIHTHAQSLGLCRHTRAHSCP